MAKDKDMKLPDESNWASKLNGEEWSASFDGFEEPNAQELLAWATLFFEDNYN
jgi:hypothetical protein